MMYQKNEKMHLGVITLTMQVTLCLGSRGMSEGWIIVFIHRTIIIFMLEWLKGVTKVHVDVIKVHISSHHRIRYSPKK